MSGSEPGSPRRDGPPPCFAIVRLGETETFRTLKQQLEEPSVVEVIWDRRTVQRRTRNGMKSPDRRRGERRNPPPEMWSTFGFVVAPQGGATHSR